MKKYWRASVAKEIYRHSIGDCEIIVGQFATKKTHFWGMNISFESPHDPFNDYLAPEDSEFSKIIESFKTVEKNRFIGKVLIPLDSVGLFLEFQGINIPRLISVKSYVSAILYYCGGGDGEISLNQFKDLVAALQTARDNADAKQSPAHEKLHPKLVIFLLIFLILLILLFIFL